MPLYRPREWKRAEREKKKDLLLKSLAGTLPATLAPFADRFTRQTADLANARMRPFCALVSSKVSRGSTIFTSNSKEDEYMKCLIGCYFPGSNENFN